MVGPEGCKTLEYLAAVTDREALWAEALEEQRKLLAHYREQTGRLLERIAVLRTRLIELGQWDIHTDDLAERKAIPANALKHT